MSGFTFQGQMDVAQYATRAQAALLAGLIPSQYVTSACPECGDQMSIGDVSAHVIFVDNEETELVLIACEGYLVVPPALVNMESAFPNWQDWTTA